MEKRERLAQLLCIRAAGAREFGRSYVLLHSQYRLGRGVRGPEEPTHPLLLLDVFPD